MQHLPAVARKIVFSGATAGCSRILSVLDATTCRQLREKLTVPVVTTGRCGEKSCGYRCNHATTVAIKTCCAICNPTGSCEKNLRFQMRPQAAVAQKVVFPGATTPPLYPYIVSAICNIWRQLGEKLTIPDATTGRSNDKTCG